MRLIPIVVLMSLIAVEAAAVLPNPLVPQRADPWIIRHSDGMYYFTGSVPEFDRIELRKAGSIEGLACAEPVTVWRRPESGLMSGHIWAPELHYIEGKWYIHFAAGGGGRGGDWNIRMYVLENDSPDPLTGNWVEKGRIDTGWDSFSLDATTFAHRGKRYLVWAQRDPSLQNNTSLFIAEMENPWTIRGKVTKLSDPVLDWEIQRYKVNEGPAVLVRNGKVFIAYSASGVDHNYCMGLLTADAGADLLDPASWAKSLQPVFRTSEENGIYGPGHNSFTVDENGNDLLVYHARNYKELKVDPLQDPNRNARVQPFTWKADGTPDFGVPLPESPARLAPQPLYRDPVHDGAADPVVLWNPHRGRWWMFYTNRRANVEEASGVTWVHGTRIGIAESCDLGATWEYVGTANINLPEEIEGGEPTHWAPDVFTDHDGNHHMLLTVVPGIFEDWNHPRNIVHLVSEDLRNWKYESTARLVNNKVIDACVLPMEDGSWMMWYNNERDGKSIYRARSRDLKKWEDGGKVVGDRPGEGPKVFRWKGYYWLVTDVWNGLGVYRSDDAMNWTLQPGDNLLQHPGHGTDDGVVGRHPDVVVVDDRAYLFYFTHPGQTQKGLPDGYETRRSSLQVTELHYNDGWLTTDRDSPVYLKLDPGLQTR